MTADNTRCLAKILADSVSPDGVRLTTMEVVMPRIVLAEFNTHRILLPDGQLFFPFSRNSASSRAIPVETMLRRVVEDPYVPEQWDRNGAGMQGHGIIEGDSAEDCKAVWLRARDLAVAQARQLLQLSVHKQTTNRLLEPFLWHTVIVTATEWDNFFHLRDHDAAHPAIRNTAKAMREAQLASTPKFVDYGEWHLPLVDERDADLSIDDKVKVSCARCARVSYLTHDGRRDPQADIDLYDRLWRGGHMSPTEHVARPMTGDDAWSVVRQTGMVGGHNPVPSKTFAGNFRGWVQLRKHIAGEADILGHRGQS